MALLICLLLGCLWLLYYFWSSNNGYWRKRGVPSLEPSFPFGNLKEIVLFKRFQGFVFQDIYNKLAPHPYGGVHELRRPVLVVRDPEIIKLVLVKEFSSFTDRIQLGKADILAQHLFNLRGARWKALRVKLTPTFTSGKLKGMFQLFEECSSRMSELLEVQAAAGMPFDVKEVTSSFTIDTVASCAFGVNLRDGTDDRIKEALTHVVRSTNLFQVALLQALDSIFPGNQTWLKFRVFPPEVEQLLIPMIRETVEYREKNNFRRGDMIDLLIELKNMTPKEGEVDEIELDMNMMAAQCFVFLLAGFETSSSVQSYCLLELSLNQEIQDRLRAEILEIKKKHGGLTYQAIQEMTYLDQVVSETMRKYPTLPVLHRHCTKRFRMPDSEFVVEEGTRLVIPTYALHHDPDHFPDPERFDPDRFSAERKDSIKPYTYLPFGEGPRICIGMRFGLIQTKLGLCTLLSKYKILPVEETETPLKFICSTIITCSEGPIRLLLKQAF